MSERRLIVGSDHAAVGLRDAIAAALRADGWSVEVRGPTDAGEKVDYPDVAFAVAEAVARGDVPRGILACGTGIGVSIAANKVPGIRAALVHDPHTAELAAMHNDANVLCLGGRLLANEYGILCVKRWLETPFEARHAPRLARIAAREA
jgi:RpiB/LacA/LacB family sugar-phosphate isomerase